MRLIQLIEHKAEPCLKFLSVVQFLKSQSMLRWCLHLTARLTFNSTFIFHCKMKLIRLAIFKPQGQFFRLLFWPEPNFSFLFFCTCMIDSDSNSFQCAVHPHLTILIIITPHLDITIQAHQNATPHSIVIVLTPHSDTLLHSRYQSTRCTKCKSELVTVSSLPYFCFYWR